jgi:hypothetical protein
LKIGNINSNENKPTVVFDTFELNADGTRTDTASVPRMTRALIVGGLKEGTRLAGVGPAKRDGILSYFNDDNSARLDNCVRFPDGCYAEFLNDRYDLPFRERRSGEVVKGHARANVGYSPASHMSPAELPDNAGARKDLVVHCSLGHAQDTRIRESNLVMTGTDLSRFEFDAAHCRGCRLGKTTAAPVLSSSAPSMGGRPLGRVHEPMPSTTGYDYFGQRVDTDLCTTLPASFPHGFTCMLDFMDRSSAEGDLYFQVHPNSVETASSLEAYAKANEYRLRDGRITRWHLDNDTAWDGPETRTESLGR